MNLQTSVPGICYPARLISLIALNILGLIMNAIAANDFSTIASSQQQLQLIFEYTPCSYFPSSTQTSAACSRQEVFQIAHGAGNDTYALLMGNNRNQISLVNTNFFTDKNLSHIDRIAPIEAQVYDVNNTKTNTFKKRPSTRTQLSCR